MIPLLVFAYFYHLLVIDVVNCVSSQKSIPQFLFMHCVLILLL